MRKSEWNYRSWEIAALFDSLKSKGAFDFHALESGIFSAATLDQDASIRSGYGCAWVRDNVYVALAHYLASDEDIEKQRGLRTVASLESFFEQQQQRFQAIIAEPDRARDPMNRPHVRFDGVRMTTLSERWAHAQNDALGYFLWIYCLTRLKSNLDPNWKLLDLFARYFHAIRYWEDEDSGHWEERRKVEASSIGVVVAALRELRKLMEQDPPPYLEEHPALQLGYIRALIAKGEGSLADILPYECIQEDPKKRRRYDAALLFLVYPLEVVDESMGLRIVEDAIENLMGDFGIRRYLGDSYWTADYKKRYRAPLTADVSEDSDERDALAQPGEEAQWCLFDPIISCYFGRRYKRTRDMLDLERQTQFFRRSLSQLTGPDAALRCPEAYYLEQGRYVPNDHVPLLWTQANLWLAFWGMRESLAR